MRSKERLKHWLGRVPGLAEADWYLRGRRQPQRWSPRLQHALDYLERWAPTVSSQPTSGRSKVAVFAMLAPWIGHTTVLSMALAAQGHEVAFGFLPYPDWQTPTTDWELKKRSLGLQDTLRSIGGGIRVTSLWYEPRAALPPSWEDFLHRLSAYDVEYTLQREGADTSLPLYRLRLARNRRAAQVLAHWLRRERPDVLVVPNGAILEFGVAYEVGQRLGIPVITYEFEYMRNRVWLSQRRPVMDLDTDDLWTAARPHPLSPAQIRQMEAMMTARRGGRPWGVHTRAWQNVGRAGSQTVRQELKLDNRPLALLATNVFGDSVTIGRQVFTQGMSDWLSETLRFFARQNRVQLVVRVHPGERLLAPGGTSLLEVVRATLPQPPEHIKIIPPDAQVNSYDLVELAQAGLVYTTTLGLEMAMDGLPVAVAGQVHYRGRGFTHDPTSWEDYFNLLEQMVTEPERLRPSAQQVDLARRYAYHFFFTYPRPYPWHILFFGEDLERWPLASALAQPEFAETLENFAGTPLNWEQWITQEEKYQPPEIQPQNELGAGSWQRLFPFEESQE